MEDYLFHLLLLGAIQALEHNCLACGFVCRQICCRESALANLSPQRVACAINYPVLGFQTRTLFDSGAALAFLFAVLRHCEKLWTLLPIFSRPETQAARSKKEDLTSHCASHAVTPARINSELCHAIDTMGGPCTGLSAETGYSAYWLLCQRSLHAY
jgi:hypothetical protein